MVISFLSSFFGIFCYLKRKESDSQSGEWWVRLPRWWCIQIRCRSHPYICLASHTISWGSNRQTTLPPSLSATPQSFGQFFEEKISTLIGAKAQITGPHTPHSSSANVWHPSSFPVGASQVCQIFSQMYYTFFCSSNYQLEQYYQNHLSSIHKDALNFLEKFCCVIFRLSVMSMRHDIRYKCPLSICFCGSSCVLSVRVSRHPFVWLCALPGSQDH